MAANRLAKSIAKRKLSMHRYLDNNDVKQATDLVELIEKRDIMVRESVTNPKPFILPGCLDDDRPIRLGDMVLLGSQEEKINDDHSHYKKQGW
jgi:hypothetical protein